MMSHEYEIEKRINVAVAKRLNDTATKTVNFIGDIIECTGKILRYVGVYGIIMGNVCHIYNYCEFAQHKGFKASSHVLHWDEDMTVWSDEHYNKKEVDAATNSVLTTLKRNVVYVINGCLFYCTGKLMCRFGHYLRQRKVNIW